MARLSKPLRLLFIACAGIGMFYVTAQWARGERDSREGIVEPVAKAASRPAGQGIPPDSMAATTRPESDSLLRLSERARSIPSSRGDLFSKLNWLPPPPPPPPPSPPAPPPKPAEPVTPPLPFTFVGMLERGTTKPEAFLAKGDALLVVSVGDLLDNNTYRVEIVTANEVVMTYLPMNIQQTLVVPGGIK